jgi:hypothetical protein
MDIRIFKVREWIDEGALVTTYCNTLSMAADIGTNQGIRGEAICLLP